MDEQKPTTLTERKQIIDWVNSLPIEECQQANSSLSFKNGGNQNQTGFLDSVIFDTNDDNASIYNITLACREIAEIWEDFNLNPEIVFCEEEEVFRFLKILRDLNFIIQNDTADLEQLNHTSHVEPVELTQSILQDSDRNQEVSPLLNKRVEENGEFRLINQNDLIFRERETNVESNYKSYTEEYGQEINDIREIENELKQNLMNSNSNFRNPTLEEPSPGNSETYGPYHSNMIKHEVIGPPPLLDRIERMTTSNSNPMFRAAESKSSTNGLYRNTDFRGSGHYPTPTNYNYAVNDQISMFSSQDKRGVNTSDIVEYNKEVQPKVPPQNYADTFERDPGFQRAHTTRTNPVVHHYETFQPIKQPKTEQNDENTENPDQEGGFSFDKKNLFSIEDLHSKENKPLRELKVESKSQRDNSGSRKRKLKPLDLPMTTFKAQKHQKLIRQSENYSVNKISADSPLRMNKSHSRIGSKSIRDKSDTKENKYNTSIFKRGLLMQSNQWINPQKPFFKFIHTSLPFCNIQLDYNNNMPLSELDIAWRNDEGQKDPIIEDLFSDEEIDNQFIPLPVQGPSVLNKDLSNEFKTRTMPKSSSFETKSRSLVRPTPVKNHKIIKDESEDDIISEMRSLTVRPTYKDNQNQSLTQTQNTARMRTRTLEMENEIVVDPVKMKTKRKILKWLEDINLIRRKAVTIKEFPQF